MLHAPFRQELLDRGSLTSDVVTVCSEPELSIIDRTDFRCRLTRHPVPRHLYRDLVFFDETLSGARASLRAHLAAVDQPLRRRRYRKGVLPHVKSVFDRRPWRHNKIARAAYVDASLNVAFADLTRAAFYGNPWFKFVNPVESAASSLRYSRGRKVVSLRERFKRLVAAFVGINVNNQQTVSGDTYVVVRVFSPPRANLHFVGGRKGLPTCDRRFFRFFHRRFALFRCSLRA